MVAKTKTLRCRFIRRFLSSCQRSHLLCDCISRPLFLSAIICVSNQAITSFPTSFVLLFTDWIRAQCHDLDAHLWRLAATNLLASNSSELAIREVSMTAYATRSPLQLLTNTHHLMAEQRQSGRRTSARLREKEDAPPSNGVTHGQEKPKTSAKLVKTSAHGQAAEGRTRAKRKLGIYPNHRLMHVKSSKAAKTLAALDANRLLCTLTDA